MLAIALSMIVILAVGFLWQNDGIDDKTDGPSFLETASKVAIDTMDSPLTLELSSIQLKQNNDFSGEIALVYSKKGAEGISNKDDLSLAVDRMKEQISKQMEEIIATNGFEVKLLRVESNDKEVFAVFKAKRMNQIHPNLILDTPTHIQQSNDYDKLIYSILPIKLKYIQDSLIPQALHNAIEFQEQLTLESDSLNVIKLEADAKKIKNNFNANLKTMIGNYNLDVSSLVDQVMQQVELSDGATLIKDEPKVLQEFREKLITVNDSYEKQMIHEMQTLKQAYMDYDETLMEVEKSYKSVNDKDLAYKDKQGVASIIKMLNGYLDQEKNVEKSILEIEEEMNNYYISAYQFSQAPQASIRISIEGKLVNIESSKGNKQIVLVVIGALVILGVLFILNRRQFKKIAITLVLLLVATTILYPVLWIIGSSFNKGSDLLSVGISPFPKEFSLVQYKRLFITTNYISWFINTFKIATVNMILSVVLTVSTAYVLSRFKFKGKKPMLMTMLILQVFPSFLGMVAIYTLLSRITFLSSLTGTTSLLDTHLGLIIVYAAGQIPYNSWLVKGYFDTIPMSIDEAARIDGASHLQAFFKVILPLGLPIISFVAVTNFMGPWMDFIFPRLILVTPEKKTLAVGLYEMINGKSNNNFTLFAAGAVLIAVPITFLFSYFQKFIVTGLSAGAEKG